MKKNYKIIISIVLSLVILLLGGTYAWYTWKTNENNETKITTELGAVTIAYDSGANLTGKSINPVSKKESGLRKTITVKASESSVNKVTFNLYLDINTLDEGLKEESFKYAIYKSSTLIKEGNFSKEYLNNNLVTCDKNNNSHIVLLEGETITSSNSTYDLYIWIDGTNYDNPITMQNQSFTFTLHASGENAIIDEAKYPDITKIKEGTLAHKIASSYLNSEKTEVHNAGVTYYYDTNNSLMSDIGGNVRYYGASPNNYIYFNCDDYSNQSSDTCELWRIIGVFNDKVKIVRNESLGSFSWDSNKGGRYFYNRWSDSSLNNLLNNQYYNNIDTTYYNGSSYSVDHYNVTEITVNFNTDNTGLKNDTTRNMINDVTWNLGGWSDTSSVYSNEIYKHERGTKVHSSNSFSWNGKIALMYPSDYGYAEDFSKCSSNFYGYHTRVCTSNNWLYNSTGKWLLTIEANYYYSVWYVASNCSRSNACETKNVHPTLFLDSKLKVESDGDGSSTSPYKLIVN